jgi:apolipoprotein N-acyltransferase
MKMTAWTTRTRLLAAALAGVVWGISFPLPGVAGLAWAVPGLLLTVTGGAPGGLTFRAGYVAAAVHYLISLSWLRHIPFPAGAYTGWFALSFFLALFPPVWAAASWRMARRLRLVRAGPFTFRELGDDFTAAPWLRLNLWFLACAAAWVAWEMFIARLFGGFPWNLLGASQYRMLPLIQVASVTGIYGVSFTIVWFSVSLFTAVILLLRDPDKTLVWRRPLIFPALIMVAIAFGGFLAVFTEPKAPRRLSLGLIQPAIPQNVIFDPDAVTNRFEALLRLTEQTLATRPDLVVWPEASLPGGLERSDFDRLAAAIKGARTWLIFGADEAEPDETDAGTPGRAYNSAFLMDPEGRIVASYRKRRLVMFGEYIPLADWFPFLRRLAPIGDGFHPGRKPESFRLENLGVTASPLICFEDNFPQQAREHAGAGVDFLVNLTNDAWFDRSAAQWQHLANAVFRAVENGIPLIRATNNGISCWVDARGRVHSVRLAEGRDVYDPGFDLLTLTFGNPGGTFYNRFGDVFGWACVMATLGMVRPELRNRAAGDGSGGQLNGRRVEA